jgi:hypothetical protein
MHIDRKAASPPRKPCDHATSLPLRSLWKPMPYTSHTNASHRLDWPSVVYRALVLALWLNQATSGFVVNHCKPRRLSVTSMPIPLMNWLPRSSRLGLGFEAQPRNHTWLCLALLATMQSALDHVGHRISQTKPTCVSTPWKTHMHRTFMLILHLHQRKSSRNLHLQY